jgi:hypothetical protein
VNIAVWIASVLLAAAYLFIGGTKLLKSKERLAENPSTAGAAEACLRRRSNSSAASRWLALSV